MVSGVSPELGPLLRRLRESRGITSQRKLLEAAEEAGVKLSSGGIGELERGTRNASVGKINDLALVLGLDEDEHRDLLIAAGHDPSTGAVGTLVDRVSRLEDRFASLEEKVDRLLRRRGAG